MICSSYMALSSCLREVTSLDPTIVITVTVWKIKHFRVNPFIYTISLSWLNVHSLLLHPSIVYRSLMDQSDRTLASPWVWGLILKESHVKSPDTDHARFAASLNFLYPSYLKSPEWTVVIVEIYCKLRSFRETRARTLKFFRGPIILCSQSAFEIVSRQLQIIS